jgi:hypothetical protein
VTGWTPPPNGTNVPARPTRPRGPPTGGGVPCQVCRSVSISPSRCSKSPSPQPRAACWSVRRLSRAALTPFFAARPPGEVVLEACGSAHHWGWELQRLGHTVGLLPASSARHRSTMRAPWAAVNATITLRPENRAQDRQRPHRSSSKGKHMTAHIVPSVVWVRSGPEAMVS